MITGQHQRFEVHISAPFRGECRVFENSREFGAVLTSLAHLGYRIDYWFDTGRTLAYCASKWD